MKILIVDDSSMVRHMIIMQLENLHAQNIHQAEDGGSAYEFLITNPDTKLVLLDWNMPGETGFVILKKIKSNPDLKHIEVVMISTESNRKKMVAAMSAGARDFLPKPFQPSTFKETIAPLLE